MKSFNQIEFDSGQILKEAHNGVKYLVNNDNGEKGGERERWRNNAEFIAIHAFQHANGFQSTIDNFVI